MPVAALSNSGSMLNPMQTNEHGEIVDWGRVKHILTGLYFTALLAALA